MLVDLNLEDAQNILLNSVSTLSVEYVPSLHAYGRILAVDTFTGQELPPEPQSAVDGFAIHADDTDGDKVLNIREWPGLKPSSSPLAGGQVVAVVTGGVLPAGTAAVLPREKAVIKGDRLSFTGRLAPGSQIRLAGEDFRTGELIGRKGTRLTPGLVGLMAAMGILDAGVFQQPRVAILSLDNRIAPYGVMSAEGQIRDSNGPMLSSLVSRDGCVPSAVEVVAESGQLVKDQIASLLKSADLVITIGGTFAGEKSEVLSVLEDLAAEVLFSGVRIQPGGHPVAAVVDSKLIISLSGNPAACAVGYETLVAPVLRAMQGAISFPCEVWGYCTNSYPRKDGGRRFVRGYTFFDHDSWKVTVLPGQKPGMLRSVINCNALIDLPAGSPALEKGTRVKLWLLDSESCLLRVDNCGDQTLQVKL